MGYSRDVFDALSATRSMPNFEVQARKIDHGDSAAPHPLSTYHPDPLITQEVASYLARTFTETIKDGDEHLYGPSIAITEMLLSGDDYVA